MSHAEGRKDMVKNGRMKSFGNTKIDVDLVTDKPHKVEMSKENGEKSDGGNTVVDHQSPKSSSKFVPEINHVNNSSEQMHL